MTAELKPSRGGFLRPFGCGWFIREFLKGNGPEGSPKINPEKGAPQSEIFHQYKTALLQATARDRAAREEERQARDEDRAVDPDRIAELYEKHLARLPYKANGCRYHSFVVYFSNLQRLGWVEATGRQEPSALQTNYPEGQPRKFFKLTPKGLSASDEEWANPLVTLYGRS
ncbi:MAG: hypothetical protein R6U37_08665 [Dehalococcoidia bacterium]